jgi:hypothetical protein
LPLEITVCTFLKTNLLKDAAELSVRMFGFKGPMPRSKATYFIRELALILGIDV